MFKYICTLLSGEILARTFENVLLDVFRAKTQIGMRAVDFVSFGVHRRSQHY